MLMDHESFNILDGGAILKLLDIAFTLNNQGYQNRVWLVHQSNTVNGFTTNLETNTDFTHLVVPRTCFWKIWFSKYVSIDLV